MEGAYVMPTCLLLWCREQVLPADAVFLLRRQFDHYIF